MAAVRLSKFVGRGAVSKWASESREAEAEKGLCKVGFGLGMSI